MTAILPDVYAPMMLELCAGFGGQSQPFLEAGYDVLRIDNNPLLGSVEKMVIADVFDLEVFNLSSNRIDYIHAGPTCLEFSLAFNAPRAVAIRNGEGNSYYPHEGVKLVKRVKEIIDILKPRYWSIENVHGAQKYLNEILGEPRLIVGPYIFWGNFPLFDFDAATLPNKSVNGDKYRRDPLRMNYRAKMPHSLAKAFLTAMRQQKTLKDFP